MTAVESWKEQPQELGCQPGAAGEQSARGYAQAGRTGARSGSRRLRRQTGWAPCCSETASTGGRLPAPCGTQSLCRPGRRSEVRGEMLGSCLGCAFALPWHWGSTRAVGQVGVQHSHALMGNLGLVEMGIIIITPLYSHTSALQGLLSPFGRSPGGNAAQTAQTHSSLLFFQSLLRLCPEHFGYILKAWAPICLLSHGPEEVLHGEKGELLGLFPLPVLPL